MGSVLIDLTPVIIGAIALPVWLIIVLLLLQSSNGVTKALAFLGGATLARLTQGILFGLVFGANDSESDGTIKYTLLLVLGILLWVTAIKKIRKEEDPDAPPPKWLTSVGGMSAVKAFGVGALLIVIAPKLWVFTLSAIAIIEAAALGMFGGVVAYLLYVLIAQSVLLFVIVAAAWSPEKSAPMLDSMNRWLEKNNSIIVIIVSVIFGGYFLWQGITGLALFA
jgi:hypothetical protein